MVRFYRAVAEQLSTKAKPCLELCIKSHGAPPQRMMKAYHIRGETPKRKAIIKNKKGPAQSTSGTKIARGERMHTIN